MVPKLTTVGDCTLKLTIRDRECTSNQILTEFLIFEAEHNEREEAKRASSRPEFDDSLLLMFYPYS